MRRAARSARRRNCWDTVGSRMPPPPYGSRTGGSRTLVGGDGRTSRPARSPGQAPCPAPRGADSQLGEGAVQVTLYRAHREDQLVRNGARSPPYGGQGCDLALVRGQPGRSDRQSHDGRSGLLAPHPLGPQSSGRRRWLDPVPVSLARATAASRISTANNCSSSSMARLATSSRSLGSPLSRAATWTLATSATGRSTPRQRPPAPAAIPRAAAGRPGRPPRTRRARCLRPSPGPGWLRPAARPENGGPRQPACTPQPDPNRRRRSGWHVPAPGLDGGGRGLLARPSQANAMASVV